MRTLFSDIDSVLNTNDDLLHNPPQPTISPLFSPHHKIHTAKLRMITDFCGDNDIQIVITSDWRRIPRIQSWLKKLFKKFGVNLAGFTPELSSREAEINHYITHNPVTQFAILDDIPLSIVNFVHVDWHIGLTQEYIDSVAKFLGV